MTLAVIFDSVGFGEWFVLLAVVLVVVGPRRLPHVARTLGQYYSRFRRAADNFKRQLMDMETEFDKGVAEVNSQIEATVSDASADMSAEASAEASADTSADMPQEGQG